MPFFGLDARTWFLALDLFILAVSGGTAAWLFVKLRRAERLALPTRR